MFKLASIFVLCLALQSLHGAPDGDVHHHEEGEVIVEEERFAPVPAIIPAESYEVPVPVESYEVPVPVESYEVPVPVESYEVPLAPPPVNSYQIVPTCVPTCRDICHTENEVITTAVTAEQCVYPDSVDNRFRRHNSNKGGSSRFCSSRFARHNKGGKGNKFSSLCPVYVVPAPPRCFPVQRHVKTVVPREVCSKECSVC